MEDDNEVYENGHVSVQLIDDSHYINGRKKNSAKKNAKLFG